MKISNETKIGALAFISVAIFYFGFQFLKGKTFFKGVKMYYSEYKDVSGVEKSSPVKIRGMQVGKVTQINMHPDNPEVMVLTYEVDDEIKIPLNSIARVTSADFLGTKQITIEIGDSSVLAENGDIIKGALASSLEDKVDEVIAPLKKRANNLIESVDSMVVVAREIIQKSGPSLGRSIENLEGALAAFTGAAYKVDTLVGSESYKFKRILGNLESISKNFKDNNETITTLMDNLSAITDSVKRSKLTNTIASAQQAMDDFSAISKKINQGDGSMGLLLNDKKLYNNLEASAADLDRLLLDLQQNPEDYVNFSLIKIDFGGKGKRERKRKAQEDMAKKSDSSESNDAINNTAASKKTP